MDGFEIARRVSAFTPQDAIAVQKAAAKGNPLAIAEWVAFAVYRRLRSKAKTTVEALEATGQLLNKTTLKVVRG